jgi:hypothetical protein
MHAIGIWILVLQFFLALFVKLMNTEYNKSKQNGP